MRPSKALTLPVVVGLGALLMIGGRSLDPFQSAFRLKISEPLEGATLPEAPIRVVVGLEPRPQTTPPEKDVTPPPRPRIEIFLDNESKGSPKPGQDTVLLQNVAAGTHTLLVTASDPGSGAVIERKEVHFTVLPPP